LNLFDLHVFSLWSLKFSFLHILGLLEDVFDLVHHLLEALRLLDWLLAFLVDHGHYCVWSLAWVFKLQEWVRMWDRGLTFGAEVEIWHDRALVADSDDW